MDGYSKDIVKEDIEKLKSIFPQCVVEGKVKIDQLLNILGIYDEKDYEKYEFTWKGKNECYKTARERTKATLIPCESESVNFNDTQNLYIEGDNLEVLKILQQGYYNKIKMIYIDPPYNTGNDFVYKDDYKDSLENYKKTVSSIGKSNPETSGRFHTDWLNMMFPRLMLAHTLLKDDGVIFISIDDNEVDNLKKLCNEVFGESNYVSTISVINNLKGRSDDKFFATCNEFLCVYAKNKDKLEIKGFELDEEEIDNEYKLKDDLGNYKLIPLRKTGKGWKREDRPFMFYPILFKDNMFFSIKDEEMSNLYSIEEKIFNDDYLFYLKEKYEKDGFLFILPLDEKNNYGRWRWGLKTFQNNKNLELELNSKNKVYSKMRVTIENGNIRLKSQKTLWYKSSYDTGTGNKTMKNLFNGIELFENPKSVYFLKDIFKLIDNNEIILDFFSGSATTAHAVMQLNAEDGGNRKYIMVQLPELCDEKTEAYKSGYKNICEIGKERIRRAGAKIKEEIENTENLDIGFRVFKLDSSNFNRWDIPLFDDVDINEYLKTTKEIIDNRTEVDAMFEILIKNGFPLTEKIYTLDIVGYKFYHIAEGCLVLVSFEENMPIEVIEQATLYLPAKLILTMPAFEDTSAMVTAKHIINKDYSIQFEILGENDIN